MQKRTSESSSRARSPMSCCFGLGVSDWLGGPTSLRTSKWKSECMCRRTASLRHVTDLRRSSTRRCGKRLPRTALLPCSMCRTRCSFNASCGALDPGPIARSSRHSRGSVARSVRAAIWPRPWPLGRRHRVARRHVKRECRAVRTPYLVALVALRPPGVAGFGLPQRVHR